LYENNDVVLYIPTREDNEERSVEFFKSCIKDDPQLIADYQVPVSLIIKATKNHTSDHINFKDISQLSNFFNMFDMNILEQDFPELLKYEKQIFKEYQFVDWLVYKENRLKFLKEQQRNPRYHNLYLLIQYLECHTPNIGFFAGSFNPFHKGHYNILLKAEQIFDKVINKLLLK
jgi:predicted metal-dependent HD superfamily phosphohydrolase